MSSLTIRGRSFLWGARTYIMGIINVTPDSFSGDGLAGAAQPRPEDITAAVVAQAHAFAADGADIIDIGGESTRPGAAPVSSAEEIVRVVPAIEACARAVSLPISIDTSKADVARAALQAGASMVNDVWGLRADPALAAVCAAAACPVVLMHNRRTSKDAAQTGGLGSHFAGLVYHDLMAEIGQELSESMSIAARAGVQTENIIVDPGFGFAKNAEHNLELMRRLGELRALGRPILLGPSRKSTIGLVLGLPVNDRLEGTAALVALGIAGGADIVRVHDVAAMARVARMADAVVRGWTRP